MVSKEDVKEDVEEVVEEEGNLMIEEKIKTIHFNMSKVIKILLTQTNYKIPPLAIIPIPKIAIMHNYATNPSPVSCKFKIKGKVRRKSRFTLIAKQLQIPTS